MGRVLEEIAAQSGNRIKTAINPGEGAFYGPKFEYVLRDAIGRDWQCGTTQVDFNLPERFGAFYIDHDGTKKTPVDGPPGDLRLDGALRRHPDRALRRPLPALARAGAGGRRDDHVGRRRLCPRGDRRGREGGPARRGRPAQREDQLQGPRALAGQGAGDPRRRPQGGGRAHGLDPPPWITGAKVARIGAGARRSRGRGAAARPASAPLPRTRAAPRSISPSTAITSSRGRSPDATAPRRRGAVPGPAPAFPVDVGGGEADVPELLLA